LYINKYTNIKKGWFYPPFSKKSRLKKLIRNFDKNLRKTVLALGKAPIFAIAKLNNGEYNIEKFDINSKEINLNCDNLNIKAKNIYTNKIKELEEKISSLEKKLNDIIKKK
jgi:hypothetical protein